MSTELGGMWQTSERTGLRQRVKVGHHLGRLNAQARLTRLAVEQSWQRHAEELERATKNRALSARGRQARKDEAHATRTRLKASQRARKVGGLAF